MRALRWTLCPIALAFLVPGLAVADGEVAGETGPGIGFLIGNTEGTDCGSLVFHTDSSYENGYAWRYGGVQPPDYGAFAECIDGPAKLCSVVADLTRINDLGLRPVDVFVYGDDGGIPGAVLASYPGNDPGPIGFWPSVTRHVFPVTVECLGVDAPIYVAVYDSEASFGISSYFVGADLDGPGGGCTLTKIAPGIGYPTGWQNVSIVWGPTQALGLGAEIVPCDPVPVLETSWGRIKTLY